MHMQRHGEKPDGEMNGTSKFSKLVDVLTDLKKQSLLEKEKEELRKKYENYKTQFIKEKTEKDKLAAEVAVLK